MQSRQIRGTTDWTQYAIDLPLDPNAELIAFGALLAGAGTLWVDDLELLVDGVPYDRAPPRQRELTVLDTDHEFDAGSGIADTTLTRAQIADLAVLGKVWGFLKYHHPAVMDGQRHWDYDLFRILPRVLAAAGREPVGDLLDAWIETLGPVPPCTECAAEPVDAHLLPDLAWTRDQARLGAALCARLQAIHARRGERSKQFYVDFTRGAGNPLFINEPAYAHLAMPDPGYRLLALYRFWNVVQWWFPYRDLVDGDWNATLAEFIPRVMAATDRDTYQLELMALIARVHDTHANLWSSLQVRAPRGDGQLPVITRFLDGDAVVTGYNHGSLGRAGGLAIGDVIERINHRPLTELVRRWSPWYAASNEPTRLRDIGRMLTRGPCGPVSVRVRRGGETLDLNVDRLSLDDLDLQAGRFHDRPGPTCVRLSDDLAYLKLSSVSSDSISGYLEIMDGTRGLVVDIRNYPTAFMVFDFTGHLITEPTPFVCFTVGDAANPGAFTFTPPLSIPPLAPHYAGRVVVLVDEVTQSSAEYTAMSLRAAGATVIGSTTAGADGNVSRITLPGGLQTMISGLGVFYPDRTPTQRVGIVPDVVVRPTREGIMAGRDEVLETAARILTE